MEEKKALAKTDPPTNARRKVRDKKVQPYVFLIPVAIVAVVILALSSPFSQLAATVVICMTILILAVMLGSFIKSLLGGDSPQRSPQQQRAEWLVSQSLRIADGLKTRRTETSRPDGTVQRSVEGLSEEERRKIMTILEKALTDVNEEELPLPQKETKKEKEADKLELNNDFFEDDWPFN